MSRYGDLYQSAVLKAAPPFRRLYFDTDPLTSGSWPTVSGLLKHCFYLALVMKVELCVPEPALHERQEQWVREALQSVEKVRASTNAAREKLGPLVPMLNMAGPSEEDIRRHYHAVEAEAIMEYKIRRTPCDTSSLEEVFQKAVARDFTFEQVGKNVVGFQDCVILLSAVQDLRTSPLPAAFVSADHIFRKIPDITPPEVGLLHIAGIEALRSAFDEAIESVLPGEVRNWLDGVERGVKQALEANREMVQSFLQRNVNALDVERLFEGKVLALGPPVIERFEMVRPDIEQGEPLQFTCDVSVSYTATIEEPPSQLSEVFASLGGFFASPSEVGQKSITVKLVGRIDSSYKNPTLESARLRSRGSWERLRRGLAPLRQPGKRNQ